MNKFKPSPDFSAAIRRLYPDPSVFVEKFEFPSPYTENYKALEVSLWILMVADKQCESPWLSSSEIYEAATDWLRIDLNQKSIVRALARAGNRVITRQVEGIQVYSFAKVAEKYLCEISKVNKAVAKDIPVRSSNMTSAVNKQEIFISHSSKDEPLVKLFVEQLLRLGMEIKTERIFCTSLETMGIKNGAGFRKAIHSSMDSSNVVILLITSNYKYSEICQNEMGAAWFSGKQVIPFIAEPITFKTVGVLMEPNQIPRLSDGKALTQFCDEMKEILGLDKAKFGLWEPAKNKFLAELPSALVKLEVPLTKTPEEIKEMNLEISNLNKRLKKIESELDKTKKLYGKIKDTKDRTLVSIAEAEVNGSLLDEFELHSKKVKKALSEFDGVVKAIILCDYYKKDYLPPLGHHGELNGAERKKQIYLNNDDLYCSNDNNASVKKVISALDYLGEFVSDHESELLDLYRDNYKADLEVDNQSFWEEQYYFTVPQ